MLCELEYDKWMEEIFAKANPYTKRGLTKTAIHKHWKDALSLTSLRAVAGNYNVLRNPSSKEDRTVYKASEYTMKAHEDYIAIREQLGDLKDKVAAYNTFLLFVAIFFVFVTC